MSDKIYRTLVRVTETEQHRFKTHRYENGEIALELSAYNSIGRAEVSLPPGEVEVMLKAIAAAREDHGEGF